jgi:hypothetical protein
MDDIPPTKRLFSEDVGGGGLGGPAFPAVREFRNALRKPPRSSIAPQQLHRLWVGSFGRPLLLSQLKDHAEGLLAKVPAGIRSRTTLIAFNGNNSYKFCFRNLDDLKEFESCVGCCKLTEWVDARSGETRFIRIKRDRTIEGRKQGRIMSVLYGLVQRHLRDAGSLVGVKLGTSGRAQDTFFVATLEDMWVLFKVVRSDAAGSDDVVVTPFLQFVSVWGIDAATAAKFIEVTCLEARRF